MNTILQKRIKEAKKKIIQEYVESFRYENGMELEPSIKIFIEKIGNVFFEHGMSFALQNLWISVEEALPPLTQESGQVYITMDKNGYTDIKARTLDGWAGPKCWCSTERITHWMPIPELKGGEK